MALTEKQIRFCEEYLVDYNGTQAAIRAGYSPKTANEQAARLLANVSVSEYLRNRKYAIAGKLEITQERVLLEYSRIAFTDIRKFYNADGTLKKITELDDDSAAALAGIEADEITGLISTTGVTKKIKRWDKKGALDSIVKLMGWNTPENPDTPTTQLSDSQFNQLLTAAREAKTHSSK